MCILIFSLLCRVGTQKETIPSRGMSYFLSVHINYLHEVSSLKVRIYMMTVLWLLLLLLSGFLFLLLTLLLLFFFFVFP